MPAAAFDVDVVAGNINRTRSEKGGERFPFFTENLERQNLGLKLQFGFITF